MDVKPTDATPENADRSRPEGRDFLRQIVARDLEEGTHGGRVATRFPPEPNGFLHIGHAKSIILNFGVAGEVPGARCHLRFDDTNPTTEDARYVEAIQEDIRWLGYDWGEHLYFASDYFDEMYALAEHLIREGKAYVDSQAEEEIRENRGTVTEPGRPSPNRGRTPEENLDLFRRMKAGEFPNGAQVLRAKIDMASPNMLLRDPLLYRIRHAHHYRTGDRWCIYPMYDYAHPLEDAIERITHSFCTLEFEVNRPLYDWVVREWRGYKGMEGGEPGPRQYEFARGNLDYTVTSKRKLLALVNEGRVSGWDDPRMPTVAGLRRRGVTPEAIRAFWEMMGVTRTESRVDVGKLEYAIRDDLNHRAPRVLCVLRPLRVVITDGPEEAEVRDASLWPHDIPKEGTRPLPFSREIYIEEEDFAIEPPKGWRRLSPGVEVRLRHGPVVRCDEVVRGEGGEIRELRCSIVPAEEAKPKSVIHWVSAEHSLPCEVRLYDRLFQEPDPEAEGADFRDALNPDSLVVLEGARIEPSVRGDAPGTRYQFERLGYFWPDPVDSRPDRLVFNRTVTLRDSWAKQARQAPVEEKKERKEAPKPRTEPSRPAPPPERAPELEARMRRYEAELGLAPEEADLLSRDAATADFFERALESLDAPKPLANWIIHELPRVLGERTPAEAPFGAAELAELVRMVEGNELSSSAGREVLGEMAGSGDTAEAIVERLGLRQVSDRDAIWEVVEAVINENPEKVDAYRQGKTGLLGFFMGQVMRRTGGRANPEVAKELLTGRLG